MQANEGQVNCFTGRLQYIRRSLLPATPAQKRKTRQVRGGWALATSLYWAHTELEIAVFVYAGMPVAATPQRTNPNGTQPHPPLFKASDISVATTRSESIVPPRGCA